jgi:hypothetical protein
MPVDFRALEEAQEPKAKGVDFDALERQVSTPHIPAGHTPLTRWEAQGLSGGVEGFVGGMQDVLTNLPPLSGLQNSPAMPWLRGVGGLVDEAGRRLMGKGGQLLHPGALNPFISPLEKEEPYLAPQPTSLLGKAERFMGNVAGGSLLGVEPSAERAAVSGIKALTPELKAAGELEGRGVRVLGVKPEEAEANWHRHTYDEALAEIGLKYPENGPTGTKGNDELQGMLDHAYGTVLDLAHTRFDSRLLTGMQALANDARRSGVKRAQIKQLQRLYQDIGRVYNKGRLTGDDYKEIVRMIREKANELSRGGVSSQMAAKYLTGRGGKGTKVSLLDLVRNNLERNSGPEVSKRLQAVDRAYAKAARIGEATGKAEATQGGKFSPAQLSRAISQRAAKTGDLRRYQRGNANMQDVAQKGQLALSLSGKPRGLDRFTNRALAILGGDLLGSLVPGGGFVSRAVGRLGAGIAEPYIEGAVLRGKGSLQRADLARAARSTPPPGMSLKPRTALKPAGAVVGGTEAVKHARHKEEER